MKGKDFKQLRQEAGFTQKEVAKKTKKTVTYISLIETGRRKPSDTMKEQLAKLYNVGISEIFLAIKLTKC